MAAPRWRKGPHRTLTEINSFDLCFNHFSQIFSVVVAWNTLEHSFIDSLDNHSTALQRLHEAGPIGFEITNDVVIALASDMGVHIDEHDIDLH